MMWERLLIKRWVSIYFSSNGGIDIFGSWNGKLREVSKMVKKMY